MREAKEDQPLDERRESGKLPRRWMESGCLEFLILSELLNIYSCHEHKDKLPIENLQTVTKTKGQLKICELPGCHFQF